MALGFNLVGVIPATPARRLEAYLRWIERGNHGEMGYMARPDRVERRIDPRIILPQVQSILCVGLDYSTQSIPPDIANDPSPEVRTHRGRPYTMRIANCGTNCQYQGTAMAKSSPT